MTGRPILTLKNKVDYVRRAEQTRPHNCHWPGCKAQVPPAKWGCKRHWQMLPPALRSKIWHAFRPGQEETLTPSQRYLRVAEEVQAWIRSHLRGTAA